MSSKTAKKVMPLDKLDPSLVQVGRPLLEDLSAWLSVDFPNVTLGLAGGCVRDQLLGRQPKDIDLVIVGVHEDLALEVINHCNAFFSDVRNSHELAKVYARDGMSDYASKFPGEEDRFHAIAQYEPMHDRIRTLADVTDSHDHTINQFVAWLDHRGAFQAEYFGNIKSWGTCLQLRPHITADRIKRVKQICTELGWTYEEDF